MSYYELMVLFSPTLNEQEEKDQFHQVEELLKSQKANIHLVDHWGKRKLAYAIKKQRQGIYDWLYFEMDPSHASEVDRKLRMSETILRFMLLKMEKTQIGNLHREVTRRAQAAAAAPEQAPAAQTEVAQPQAEQAVEAAAPPEPAEAAQTVSAEPEVAVAETTAAEETATENREES